MADEYLKTTPMRVELREDGIHFTEPDGSEHTERYEDIPVAAPRARSVTGDKIMTLWLRPIAGPFSRISETADKAAGELTVPEIMDWVFCLAYAGLTGYIIGKAAGNLAEIALGGRRR